MSPDSPLSTTPFLLYHFNGIVGHSQSRAECRRVRVSPDRLVGGVGAGGREGLAEVVHTRWPTALVEFPGDKDHDPRIT